MKYKLYRGDCRSVIPSNLEPESIDIVVTSPPYNIGVNYDDDYHDNLSDAAYISLLIDSLDEIKKVLKPNGSVFYNVAGKPSAQEQILTHLIAMDENLSVQNMICWVKSIYIDNILPDRLYECLTQSLYFSLERGTITAKQKKETENFLNLLKAGKSFGHNKPCNSDRFLTSCWEYVIHATKNKDVQLDKLAVGVPYTDKSNIKRWEKDTDCRDRGNTWFLPYKTRKEKKSHPAAFPPALAEKCIKLHGIKPGCKVLDPFCGEGNTGIACAQLNVDFIGIDLIPRYLSLATNNIERELKEKN